MAARKGMQQHDRRPAAQFDEVDLSIAVPERHLTIVTVPVLLLLVLGGRRGRSLNWRRLLRIIGQILRFVLNGKNANDVGQNSSTCAKYRNEPNNADDSDFDIEIVGNGETDSSDLAALLRA